MLILSLNFIFQKHFSEGQDVDKIMRAQGTLDELKEIMVQNLGLFSILLIVQPVCYLRDVSVSHFQFYLNENFNSFLFFSDSVANRGEKLELLVDKTENLNANVSLCILIVLFNMNCIFAEA